MTQYTVRSSGIEADAILSGEKAQLFRADGKNYKAGDEITLLVVKDGKPVRHGIDGRRFKVTSVDDHNTAPILKGWQVLGIRRCL